MVSEGTMELTEDEAELYDRQIRLWGVESQRRLRNSKILIVGLQGFGAEITKNIILAGVSSITLLDSATVTEDDTMAQFLVPTDAFGKNRAEASFKRAQALNPMVKVTADSSNVDSKPDEYFAEFDVVVATGCSLPQLKRINTACRLQNIKFFAGEVFGMFGYAFADLLIHDYVEEVAQYLTKHEAKKVEKRTVKKTKTFVPLVDALTVDFTQMKPRRISRLDYSFFLMLALFEFRQINGRVPDRKERENDIKKLRELSDKVLKENGFPTDKIPDSILGMVFGEVSPVCAIVGGVVAQEVIKTVSQKEPPIDEFFFFNPERCCGFVEAFHSE